MKRLLRLLSINLLVLGALFLVLNLFSPYLFDRFLSAPGNFAWLPEGIVPLVQSSKSSLLPSHYIAITGDSYASGSGDWLNSELHTPHAEYSAAHLLHDKTGRDVIAFGQAGAGSVRGMVTAPISVLAWLQHTWLYRLPDPDVLLIYFYEGNDLSDNVEYLAAADKCIAPFDATKQFDDAYFASYIQQVALDHDQLYTEAMHSGALDNMFLVTLARDLYARKHSTVPFADFYKCSPYAWLGRTRVDLHGHTNRAQVHGQELTLPDSLQAPSTDLSDGEMALGYYSFEQALRFAQRRFPMSHIGIVYVPSVLASYQLVSPTVSTQPFIHREARITTPAEVSRRSDAIAARIGTIARANHVAFIDARPHIRKAALEQPVHGPDDWNHFNRAGYTALADALVDLLAQLDNASNPSVAP